MRFLLNRKQLKSPEVSNAVEDFVLKKILTLFKPSFDSLKNIGKKIDDDGDFGDGLTFIEVSNKFKSDRFSMTQQSGPEYGTYYYASKDWLDTLNKGERAHFAPYFDKSDCGIILIDRERYDAMDLGLSGIWEDIFKKWFETNTGHKICHIVVR